MINPTDYEQIGKLAYNYYIAEVERINARNQRNRERKWHPCAGIDNGGAPCWQDQRLQPPNEHLRDWCEDCQAVQPYYLAYQEAAKKARIARYSMTKAIQRKMASDDE